MKVLFRCDASPDIGAGHVTRCLTLADTLAEQGWECTFCISPETLATLPGLANTPYPFISPSEAPWRYGWLIVDHYDLDAGYEQAARQWADHILVIDDLADRPHDCDLLVDQTLGRHTDDYYDLVPKGCKILTGSDYAILSPQFPEMREPALKRREARQGTIERLLVTPGRTNIGNVTSFVLNALHGITHTALIIEVALGGTARHLDSVRENIDLLNSTSQHSATLHLDADNMAQIMYLSDLAIGAGGTTSWERCCLGLPTLLIVLANNQRKIAQELDNADAIPEFWEYVSLTEKNITRGIANLFKNPDNLIKNSLRSSKICDGAGKDRIVKVVKNEI